MAKVKRRPSKGSVWARVTKLSGGSKHKGKDPFERRRRHAKKRK